MTHFAMLRKRFGRLSVPGCHTMMLLRLERNVNVGTLLGKRREQHRLWSVADISGSSKQPEHRECVRYSEPRQFLE
ncbi:MAG TPA: hypothetical protein DDX19_19810 [Rhodopirellula baltica]|nr:hypothetical protein [Rhodopirellula baltica]